MQEVTFNHLRQTRRLRRVEGAVRMRVWFAVHREGLLTWVHLVGWCIGVIALFFVFLLHTHIHTQ